MSPHAIRDVLADAYHALQRLYGERLVRVVLYGSYARGEAERDSDVDVLVILRDPVESYWETKRLVKEVEMGLWERHSLDVHLLPLGESRVSRVDEPLVMNVSDEGIDVQELIAEAV